MATKKSGKKASQSKSTKKASAKTAEQPALNLDSTYVTQWTGIKLAVFNAVKAAKNGIGTVQVMEKAGTGKRVTRRHLYSMRQEGLVQAEEVEGELGYFWSLTAKGRKFKPEAGLKPEASQTAAQRQRGGKKKASKAKAKAAPRKRSRKKAAAAS